MDSVLMNAPASQGQILVTIDAWGTDYWADLSGGEVSGDSKEVWNGGSEQPDHLSSRAKTSNLVIKKPYYPGRDKARMEQLLKRVGKLRTTITVQDTDPDLVGGVYGPPRVYPNALLVKCKAPEGKAGSGDENVIETEWAVSGLA